MTMYCWSSVGLLRSRGIDRCSSISELHVVDQVEALAGIEGKIRFQLAEELR